MKPDEFKSKIRGLLSQEYAIEFLGENFDKIVENISEDKAEKIYAWIKNVLDKEVRPILIGSKKPYKDWHINELLTFRYAFNISAVEYRILFVKVKNSFYIEFHLGDHKYYDKVRKELELKKTN
jgi:hypothetical protein